MKRKTSSKPTKSKRTIVPGGVSKYLADCPKESQRALKDLRAAIRSVAPNAIETMSYFEMPGYSYAGYPYNGMFAWFSFKSPHARLHIRPYALEKHSKEVEKFVKTRAVISFSIHEPIPKTLVKKLVKASLFDMRKAKT